MKTCIRCNIAKPLTDFSLYWNGTRYSHCRPCHNLRRAEAYQRRQERARTGTLRERTIKARPTNTALKEAPREAQTPHKKTLPIYATCHWCAKEFKIRMGFLRHQELCTRERPLVKEEKVKITPHVFKVESVLCVWCGVAFNDFRWLDKHLEICKKRIC